MRTRLKHHARKSSELRVRAAAHGTVLRLRRRGKSIHLPTLAKGSLRTQQGARNAVCASHAGNSHRSKHFDSVGPSDPLATWWKVPARCEFCQINADSQVMTVGITGLTVVNSMFSVKKLN